MTAVEMPDDGIAAQDEVDPSITTAVHRRETAAFNVRIVPLSTITMMMR